MKFITHKYADITTAALEQKDLMLICSPKAPNHLGNVDDCAGSFFYVPTDDVVDEYRERCEAFGLSAKFIRIMEELVRREIPYVRFDRDGSEIQY